LFEFEQSVLPVAPDLTDLFNKTWRDIAAPGWGWTGPERVAIAAAARESRGLESSRGALPDEAVRAVEIIASDAAMVDEPMVRSIVEKIGLARYIELVAVASTVIGIDTMTSLLGLGIEEMPEPKESGLAKSSRVRNLKLRKAWVPTTGLPLPRLALSAVPPAQELANQILDRLYMGPDHTREVESIRGLTPIQMELVVVTVSHGNKCFYCTLGHLVTLQMMARRQGVLVDPVAIVDPEVDSAVQGGKELIALGHSAVSTNPDSATVGRVAAVLGEEAAVTAAGVASAFMMTNRIVEATGQPALTNQRERMRPILERLGAMDFPHSGLTISREKPPALQRVARRLRS
jgi:AhpD family alkylhydroperoxidase